MATRTRTASPAAAVAKKTAAPAVPEPVPAAAADDTTVAAPVGDEPALAAPVTDATTPVDEPLPVVEDPTPVPSATPLEAPAEDPDVEPDPEPTAVTVANALPDDMAGLIVDAATRQPPTELANIFEPATPHGTDGICTVRLLQHTVGSRHARPMTHLLVAKGSHLDGASIARIMQQLREQADARAAMLTN